MSIAGGSSGSGSGSSGSGSGSSGNAADLFSPLFVAGIVFGVIVGMLLEKDVLSKQSFKNHRKFFVTGIVIALTIIISDQHLRLTLLENECQVDKEDFQLLLNDCKTDFDEMKEENYLSEKLVADMKTELVMCQEKTKSIICDSIMEVQQGVDDNDIHDELSEVSIWFQSLLWSDDTGTLQCPFDSEADALRTLRSFPKWSNLQSMSGREKRKILAELSLLFHPDKMISINCHQSFGNNALIEINKQR